MFSQTASHPPRPYLRFPPPFRSIYSFSRQSTLGIVPRVYTQLVSFASRNRHTLHRHKINSYVYYQYITIKSSYYLLRSGRRISAPFYRGSQKKAVSESRRLADTRRTTENRSLLSAAPHPDTASYSGGVSNVDV